MPGLLGTVTFIELCIAWLAAFPVADHYTSDTVRRTSTCMSSPRLRLGGVGVGLDATEKQERLTFLSGGTEQMA